VVLPPRSLRRDADGSLYDLDEHRRISPAELRQEVCGGRRFRAQRHDTGLDCTYEVLAELARTAPQIGMGPEAGMMGALVGGLVKGVFAQNGGDDLPPWRRAGRARDASRTPRRQDPPEAG
jgi:hypothetical protein